MDKKPVKNKEISSLCSALLKYLNDSGCTDAVVFRDIEDGTESEIDKASHYNQGQIEVIDFIKDQRLGFVLGNVVKYVCRAPYKGCMLQDLEKAEYYLKRELRDRKRKESTLESGKITIRGVWVCKDVKDIVGIESFIRDQNLSFLLGTVILQICGHINNGACEIEKALSFLQREIHYLKDSISRKVLK